MTPDETKVKKVIFELNGESDCGLDGFTGVQMKRDKNTFGESPSAFGALRLLAKNYRIRYQSRRQIIGEIGTLGEPPKIPSRALNQVFQNTDFISYGISKWSEKLNHLAYADDTIIFDSVEKKTIALIMNVLKEYENQFGQKINKDKSYFYMFSKASNALIREVEEATCFVRGKFPIINLGCLISHAGMKKSHLNDLIKKFKKPFRFHKFWTAHEDFKKVVSLNWDAKISADPFLDIKKKIKNIKHGLSVWSRSTFGDIFQQLIIREEIARLKEKLFEDHPSEENRTVMRKAKFGEREKAEAEVDEDWCWLVDQGEIANEVVQFYQNQFLQDRDSTDLSPLAHIPKMEYEKHSGQKINKGKSFYYLHQKVALNISSLIV
ncbi:hypothetical protein H5410_045441 [Solanum commersonii]|uniref:Reverse transcriptase domain-containing protein n=1 Tax=Solanum commersonii TaxID=4109 RepID=A0A9J5XBM1_SOLCO|nr:hypothetical protein H5410_045441 [Solanum commersonii]